MGVYARGGKLWIRFRGVDGTDRRASTGYDVGQEELAREVLDQVLARVVTATADADPSVVTVRALSVLWLAQRDTETIADDRGRLENHILPALGDIPITELRPRLIRDFVTALRSKRKLGNLRKDGTRVSTDELIAPRTVRHVYGTLRAMLNFAAANELIQSNPCVLQDELPAKRDKDRTWRRTAVFTRDEVEVIISAESTPGDRRVLASMMFLGAMRFGEAAALTWRDYDATCTPLGKLVIEKSYSTKKRKVKGTKTDNPREMPVHPTLAKILAAWKLGGFEQLTGRAPRPEDPIVPSRRGAYRNVNASLRRFHEDLERIGLRARRQHDARRTFISIARADGAVSDTLHFATHGPDGDIMDDYTTLPWSALCAEVAKARISVREGQLIVLPVRMAAGAEGHGTPDGTPSEPTVTTDESWRSGRDLKARTLRPSGALSHLSTTPAEVNPSPTAMERHGAPTVDGTADRVADALEAALAARRAGAGPKALRRALRQIEEMLDD